MDEITRMAVIAGASKALKYKSERPGASESEILQRITDEMEEITDKLLK